MQKATLRREMQQKRRAYPSAEIAARSQAIGEQFLNYFNLQPVRTLHLFLPIPAQNEVDTWYIIRQLRAQFPEITIVVPITDVAGQTLSHGELAPDAELQPNQWGILEPKSITSVAEYTLDMVLVPLLAFDELGHRVGYGKGFYDRFLPQCRPDTITVGLSLENAGPQITDVHAGDVTLQYAVTPDKVYQFR
ncbi:MAG: 5-formyltetrahydrofolate cyclo-ligase [uncultured Adhaeribacter sp.]|uniref:5-formyltetrahydrofolate cyclo-ligase n=1 Tax=uncultured Adhaeribacter sp. TaxID=448109 RepID=A0A6J4JLW8_9BACT|nr:MAG: 5-formyltetrahydrofolate cyclo-ligase [uncultured Adhaeribacter sp.]